MTELADPDAQHRHETALALIEAEVERSSAANLPRLADHLRGLAHLIRTGQLAVTKLDESGMTFEPTGLDGLDSLDNLIPGAQNPTRGQRLIIEESRDS